MTWIIKHDDIKWEFQNKDLLVKLKYAYNIITDSSTDTERFWNDYFFEIWASKCKWNGLELGIS